VEPPTTTHELSVGKQQTLLESNGKTPREQAVRFTFLVVPLISLLFIAILCGVIALNRQNHRSSAQL